MKKLAAFLMILSVSVFTVGCGKTDKTVEKTVKETTTPEGKTEKTTETSTETPPAGDMP